MQEEAFDELGPASPDGGLPDDRSRLAPARAALSWATPATRSATCQPTGIEPRGNISRRTGFATSPSSATAAPARPRCTRRCCSRPASPTGSARVPDGTTVSDSDPDEQARQMSISATLSSFEWQERKINLLDTPGEPSFVADALGALRVCESAVFVVNAVMGVEVTTSRLWARAAELDIARHAVRQHARPRARRLLPHARVAQGRLRAARRRDRDPDRLRARARGRDRPRRHEGLPPGLATAERAAAASEIPIPEEQAELAAGVPREADGRGLRSLRRADGALPGGRGDLPRGDRRRAQGGHQPRQDLPRRLRRARRATSAPRACSTRSSRTCPRRSSTAR